MCAILPLLGSAHHSTHSCKHVCGHVLMCCGENKQNNCWQLALAALEQRLVKKRSTKVMEVMMFKSIPA